MKQFYTSYYARHGTDPKSVAISAKVPHYYKGKTFPLLAPTWQILNDYDAGKISTEEYERQYIALLKSRGATPQVIYEGLSDGAILLCYETPADFCHRRVLARFLEQELGMSIPELSTINDVDYLTDLIIM